MANTVISLKKSGTPSAIPVDLANGEIAINYADGKIFYKSAAGSIQEISGGGGGGNSFGTVNANGTLIVADSIGDIFSLVPGNGITITGDAINDSITISSITDFSAPFDRANLALDVANAAFDKANTGTTNVNAFSRIAVANQSNIDASTSDTLNFAAANGINITTNSFSKTITFELSAGFNTADYGSITDSATSSVDYGSL